MIRFITGAALVAALLVSGCKPYATTSVWNQTAAQKGTVTTTQPNASDWGSGAMIFGGGPGGSSSGDHASAKPIYLAQAGDPCRGFTLSQPTWNNSDTRIPDNDCIPVPSGVEAAGVGVSNKDHHLTVVSADQQWAWSFWRCDNCTETNVLANGYQATNGSKWKLSDGQNHPQGPGVASCCGSATGRGSGTELIDTVLRTEEATNGVFHALGLTTHIAATTYVNPPAIKSDGDGGTIKYGSLWVLRSDYTCPAYSSSSPGPYNVCTALKDYGAYVVDQEGSSCCNFAEIDTTGDYGTETVAKWQATGISRNSLPLVPSDWRCVDLPNVSGECP